MSPISVIVMLTYKLLFCNNGSTKFTATHFRILQSQRLTQPCYQSLLWGHMPAHGGVGLRQLQFGYRLQITWEHCASTAQRQVAESSSWEAVMCRILYCSLDFTVELSLSFCFAPDTMKNSLMRLPPGFCWNHCRVFTVAGKLHLRVQLAPSWRFRTEGGHQLRNTLLLFGIFSQ